MTTHRCGRQPRQISHRQSVIESFTATPVEIARRYFRILVRLIFLSSALFFVSCLGSRHYHAITENETTRQPRFLELQSDAAVATLHFPAGVYTLQSADNAGFYYQSARKIAQHTGGGTVSRNGGIFVSKKNPRKLRGYVFWAGALTHVGNLSHAPHRFSD